MQAQDKVFGIQRDTQLRKLSTFQQRIAQLHEEIGGLQVQIKSAQGQLKYTKEEIDSVRPLLKEGRATEPRLLALERQAEELRDVRAKINDYDEKLRAANDVMQRTVITAPSEGVITGLKFHTIGGVVAPGTPIMDIVPQSDKLVLEIRVQPTDIDVVKPGLESRVVFPAYKARRMPLFKGKVTQVSADAFNDQKGVQSVSYYTARVEVDAQQLHDLASVINLYQGMPVDVYVRTGDRSFIAYLFAPITDSMEHAFKKE